MKKFQLLFFIGIALLAFSCDPDDEVLEPVVDVELGIRANFGGDLLLMRKDYQYDDSTLIEFTQVNFYISNAVLLKNFDDSQEETELFEIEFAEFSDFKENDPGNADSGVSFSAKNIPVGDYDGLRIGLGVPPDLNSLTPADQSLGVDHPLAKSSHYWAGWQSYIFVKLEGGIDKNHDGNIEPDESFAYHLGSNDAYENAFILRNFSLVEGVNPRFELDVDLRKIFFKIDGTPAFDAIENSSTHNPDDFPLVELMMLNFSQAFSM